MERRYIAFISYRHAELDSAVAKQLHTLIEQYTIPRSLRKNGVKKLGLVFRDQEELPISSNLSDDISRALENSQYLIVVCSKNTAQSPWVGREIEYFLSCHDQQHTLAALASGEPVDVFPKALTVRYDDMGQAEEVEPLAIDIRAEDIKGMKKIMKREITRLYAALIGCPYDALVMRQQRRKRRQLAAIMGTVLAVVMSFLTVTLVKNHEIDLKNEELAGMNLTLEDKNQELEDKNDELARQKAEVQLRESELLTEKGMAAVTEGDDQRALEYFLSALPKEQGDRPYYAPAEQGLAMALGIHDEERQPYRIFETILEQKNPVMSFEISPDGSRIMTFDEYSLATCFDAATGEILWNKQVAAKDFKKSISATEYDGVIVCADYEIYFIQWQTGEILWSYREALSNSPVLSEDQSVLAVRNYTFVDDMQNLDVGYIFLNPKTGEVLQRVELGKYNSGLGAAEGTEALPYWWFDEVLGEEAASGTFSPDNTKFLLFHSEEVFDVYTKIKYVLIDWTEGTSQVIYEYDKDLKSAFDRPLRAVFTDDGQSILMIRDSATAGVAFSMEKLDLQTGKLLWTSQPEGLTDTSFHNTPLRVLYGTTIALVCRGTHLYEVELATGEIPTCTIVGSPVLTLEWTGERELSVVMKSGRYSPGWANSNGVYLADLFFEVELPLGELSEAKFYQNGMAHFVEEDDTVVDLAVNTQGIGDGYVAVRPADNECAVSVKRAVGYDHVAPETKVEIAERNQYLFDTRAVSVGENHVAIGPISCDGADGSMEHFYWLLNTETYQLEGEIRTPNENISDEVFFLADRNGYIYVEGSNGIQHYDCQTGRTEQLATVTTVTAPGSETVTGNSLVCDAAVLAADNRVLAASMDQDRLTYWLDGQTPTEVALPEDLCTNMVLGSNWYRFMMAGENGTITVGDYEPGEVYQLRGMATYDIQTKEWSYFKTPWNLKEGIASRAKNQPWILLSDDENQVHIYNYQTAEILYELDLKLPENSVKRITFTEDNRYITVQTEDNQALLYDIATGEQVFSQRMSGTSTEPLQVVMDDSRSRLYLWCNSDRADMGYCLDMETWTVLAQIPGMLGYLPQSNEVYRIGLSDVSYENLRIYQAVGWEELVRLGWEIMEQ